MVIYLYSKKYCLGQFTHQGEGIKEITSLLEDHHFSSYIDSTLKGLIVGFRMRITPFHTKTARMTCN